MGRETCPELFLLMGRETATEGQQREASRLSWPIRAERQGSGPGWKRVSGGCQRNPVPRAWRAARGGRVSSPTSQGFSVGKQTCPASPAAPAGSASLSAQRSEYMERQRRVVRGRMTSAPGVKIPLFLLCSPSPQELGFTNFIRTLREGDHERLGKKKEEL